MLLRSAVRDIKTEIPLFFSFFFSFFSFFFFFPWHLQSHPSLYVWQLVLGRGSLEKDRVALWGVIQPCEALPYPAPEGFPHSGHCQGTERGKFYYCSEEALGGTANFFLPYNRVAKVEPNFVALSRGFSGQVSP